MSYAIHDFQPGHRLRADELNAMDGQIAAQEALLDGVCAELDGQDERVRQLLYRLSLEAGTTHACLYYGDELLAEAALPESPDGVVPCTELSVTSAAPVSLNTGETAAITASRQPDDCTQALRFVSSNPGKVSVSGAGVLTGVSAGRETVTVRCGRLVRTVPVVISTRFPLGGRLVKNAYYDSAYTQLVTRAPTATDSQVCFGVEEGLLVPPGYTLAIANNTAVDHSAAAGHTVLRLQTVAFLWPGEDGFTLGSETVTNIASVALDAKSVGSQDAGGVGYYSRFASGEGASYTNESAESCYAVVSAQLYELGYNGSEGYAGRPATAEDLPFAREKLVITVTPPEVEHV